MIFDIFRSVSYYFDGLSRVRRYGLTKLLVIPIILSGIIGLLVIFTSYQFSDEIGSWITSWYSFDKGKQIVDIIGQIIGGLSIFLLGMFVFRYLVIIILAPFFSYLSERLAAKLREEQNEDELESIGFLSGFVRGVKIAASYGLKELLMLVFAVIIGFVPLIGIFSPILIIIIEAYYIGIGNMDFALESRMGYKDSKMFIQKRKGLILGNGIIGIILLMIPVFGIFVMPVLGVCAATMACHKVLDYHDIN